MFWHHTNRLCLLPLCHRGLVSLLILCRKVNLCWSRHRNQNFYAWSQGRVLTQLHENKEFKMSRGSKYSCGTDLCPFKMSWRRGRSLTMSFCGMGDDLEDTEGCEPPHRNFHTYAKAVTWSQAVTSAGVSKTQAQLFLSAVLYDQL